MKKRSAKPQYQALAWYDFPVTVRGRKVDVLLKAGGTDGFNSALVFCRQLEIGVVVLTNRDNQKAPPAAKSLLLRLLHAPKLNP